MADFITIIPQSTFNDTQKLLKDVNAIADAVERVNEQAKNIKFPSQARNVIKQTNDEIEKTKKVLSDTEVIQRRQQTAIKNLTVARSQENKTIQQQRVEAVQLNRQQREQAILTSNLTGAYQRLNLRHTQARKRLQDLIASNKANNAELRRAQLEFNRLDARVQKANRVVRDFTPNVGNYRSALTGAVNITRQLVGAFGAIEAGRFLINFTKESIQLAREARGVEFAFARIANSAEILTRTREATRGLISDLEIQRAAVQLNNFNLNVEDLDTLLQLATVRATQTGQSFEALVDQIVLGLGRESAQRLDDLGVSQSRINAEVAKGKDFVQAFVDIAREEIPRAGDVLDQAANSAQAFSAAVNNLQVEFGKLFQGGGAFGGLTRQIQRITDGIRLLNSGLNVLRNAIRQISDDFPIFRQFIEGTGRLIELFTTPGITFFAMFLIRVSALFAGLSAATRVVIDDLTNLGRALLLLTINPFKNAVKFRNVIKSLGQTARNAADEFDEAYNKALERNAERTEIAEQKTKTLTKTTTEARKAVEQLVTAFKQLEQPADQVSKIIEDGQVSLKEWSARADDAAKRTRELRNATDDFIESFRTGFFADAGLRSLEQFFDGTFDLLFAGADNLQEKFAVTFNAITETAQEAFKFIEQAQANSIAKQLDDLKTQQEIALALNEGNAEAIEAINEQAAAKEAEIKQKQAQQNKRNALFNIAIDTAQAIISTLAATPPPPGIPLAIAVGAIGALQAALVASTPVPQFKDGVENFEGGLAVVGDGGVAEVVSMPDKRTFITPATPTLVNLPKGTDVIPSLQEFDISLNRLLTSQRIEPIKKVANGGITANEMDAIFARNMRKMTVLNINMDQNGFALSVQKGLARTNIEKNRVIFKGKKV